MQGIKTTEETKQIITKRRDVPALVAQIHNVSPRYVRYVLNGDRENKKILATYMEIVEQDNLLLEAVKKAVPL